jgi:hypothetical protein
VYDYTEPEPPSENNSEDNSVFVSETDSTPVISEAVFNNEGTDGNLIIYISMAAAVLLLFAFTMVIIKKHRKKAIYNNSK